MIKHIIKRGIAALCVVGMLASCAPTPATTSATTTLQSTLTSPAGQAAVTALIQQAVPNLQAIIAKGANATAADMAIVAQYAPLVGVAVALFGPYVQGLNVTATVQLITDIGTEAAGGTPNVAQTVADLSTLITDLSPLIDAVK